MRDESTAPPPPPPSENEREEAEDTTPGDAPADPAVDPAVDPEATTEPETEEEEVDSEGEVEADSAEHAPDTPASTGGVANELPRTTTTGDEEQDLRSAGDGAVSGAPGDDLDDPSQRHD